jgi:hypothetical protein
MLSLNPGMEIKRGVTCKFHLCIADYIHARAEQAECAQQSQNVSESLIHELTQVVRQAAFWIREFRGYLSSTSRFFDHVWTIVRIEYDLADTSVMPSGHPRVNTYWSGGLNTHRPARSMSLI